eukprot:tig00020629_g12473.t1
MKAGLSGGSVAGLLRAGAPWDERQLYLLRAGAPPAPHPRALPLACRAGLPPPAATATATAAPPRLRQRSPQIHGAEGSVAAPPCSLGPALGPREAGEAGVGTPRPTRGGPEGGGAPRGSSSSYAGAPRGRRAAPATLEGGDGALRRRRRTALWRRSGPDLEARAGGGGGGGGSQRAGPRVGREGVTEALEPRARIAASGASKTLDGGPPPSPPPPPPPPPLGSLQPPPPHRPAPPPQASGLFEGPPRLRPLPAAAALSPRAARAAPVLSGGHQRRLQLERPDALAFRPRSAN